MLSGFRRAYSLGRNLLSPLSQDRKLISDIGLKKTLMGYLNMPNLNEVIKVGLGLGSILDLPGKLVNNYRGTGL